MSFNFEELARDEGYSASISAEDGSSQCTFHLHGVNDETPPKVSELAGFASYLCGSTDNVEPKQTEVADENAGKVRRTTPRTHPWMPELTVAGISTIRGTGEQTIDDSVRIDGLEPITDQFTHFTTYDYVTQFKKRPYFVLPDEFVPRNHRTYYKRDGSSQDVYYAEEWGRYTSTTLRPLPDTVNATTGAQMRFRTTGALNGAQYPGQVMVFLQNQMLEVMWYLVPYRYFFNYNGFKPYLTRFINTVNQNDFMGFLAGQLMFLGAEPQPFIPQQTNVEDFLDGLLFQSQSLLCNVKMRWLVTTREGTDVPTSGSGLDNKNNVAAGHNLQPSFTDRKFHYVTTEDPTTPADTTKWFASYESFPHELFFTDPMLNQPGGAI